MPDLHVARFVEAEDPFEIGLIVDPRAAASSKQEQDDGDCQGLFPHASKSAPRGRTYPTANIRARP